MKLMALLDVVVAFLPCDIEVGAVFLNTADTLNRFMRILAIWFGDAGNLMSKSGAVSFELVEAAHA